MIFSTIMIFFIFCINMNIAKITEKKDFHTTLITSAKHSPDRTRGVLSISTTTCSQGLQKTSHNTFFQHFFFYFIHLVIITIIFRFIHSNFIWIVTNPYNLNCIFVSEDDTNFLLYRKSIQNYWNSYAARGNGFLCERFQFSFMWLNNKKGNLNLNADYLLPS